jgi:hypothetical protein
MIMSKGDLAFRPWATPAVICLGLVLGGCLRSPHLGQSSTVPANVSPERAAALAEMRAQAEAGDAMPYPNVFEPEQTARMIARGEPRTVVDAQSVETELALIAEQRAKARNPGEIAALDARARELRKLVLARSAGELR